MLPVVVSMLLTTSCREDYYLDEEEPTWLGESIYDFLKENGEYDYFVRLIDDLDYAEVLSKTGSKTLFVVDDATFVLNGVEDEAAFATERKGGVMFVSSEIFE